MLKYQRHSATSYQAAVAALEWKQSAKAKVYRCLRVAGRYGLTDAELEAETGLKGSTQRPRRIELVAAGLVEDSGQTRKTEGGNFAVVWRVSTGPNQQAELF